MGSRGQPAPEQPWMATSACPRKQRLTCWGAVDRVAGQVSRLLSPCSPTPGFQDHRLEARLEAHHAAMDFSSPSGGRIISDPREAAAVSRSPSSRPPLLLRAHLGASTSSLVPPPNGPRAGKPCPISTSTDHGPLSCPGQQSLPAKLCPIFHNPGEDRSRPDRGSAWRGLLIGSSLVGRWSNQVCRPPATCRVPPDEPWPSPLPPHQPALLTANLRRNAT